MGLRRWRTRGSEAMLHSRWLGQGRDSLHEPTVYRPRL
jgi:hypothetical protein